MDECDDWRARNSMCVCAFFVRVCVWVCLSVVLCVSVDSAPFPFADALSPKALDFFAVSHLPKMVMAVLPTLVPLSDNRLTVPRFLNTHPSRPHVVVVSMKAEPSPFMQALAGRFRDTLVFGHLHVQSAAKFTPVVREALGLQKSDPSSSKLPQLFVRYPVQGNKAVRVERLDPTSDRNVLFTAFKAAAATAASAQA